MSGRIDKGMAGYVTDREVQQWRHRREERPLHPLRYDPPRLLDRIKTAACIGIAAFVIWFIYTGIMSSVPYCFR